MNIKKLDTTLLIITTVIAIFFFGKWINEVRPRYEFKETLTTTNRLYYNTYEHDYGEEFCQDVEYSYLQSETVEVEEDCLGDISIMYSDDGLEKYCTNEQKGKINVCYKKEKIRIK